MLKRIKQQQTTRTLHVGIDPGENGGIALMWDSTLQLFTMPETEQSLWDFLDNIEVCSDGLQVKCVLEKIEPRPTFMHGHSSVLPSTCKIYGSYMQLRAMLTSAGIQYKTVDPKRWQPYFVTARKKDQRNERAWKNLFKTHAQKLFPGVKITLATADALLLAEYCRRVNQ